MKGARSIRGRTRRDGIVHLHPDGAIAYRVLGDVHAGIPIVLCRPLGGTMALWGKFAEALGRELPVIQLDPRGVGASSPVPLLHSTRDMARDVVQLMDELQVPRAHVFGISLGAMVASYVAIDAPDRVVKLVLASALPRAAAASPRVGKDVWSYARAFMRPFVGADVALIHQVLSPEFRRAHPERVREIERIARAHPTSRRNLVALMVAAAGHDAHTALRRVRTPTLLLAGSLDPIVGNAAEHELLHELTTARLEIMKGVGHDLTLEAPCETAARVLGFLGTPATIGVPASSTA